MSQESTKHNARVIALYLPQFHPIPENDKWWGKGFTEWTNVAKAHPLFRGHYQPRIPADLGFYDLRLAETREQQVQLAREAGIEAFCYYHYWFAGHQLLERPFNEVVESGQPDFPFCLCWANHTWSSATWSHNGSKSAVLMEQTYPGESDDYTHFMSLLPAFKDPRYYKIDGKLVFSIFDVWTFPNISQFIQRWRDLAQKHGLPGFYFIGMTHNTLPFVLNADGTRKHSMPDIEHSAKIYNTVLSMGFDAVNSMGKRRGELRSKGMIRNRIQRALEFYHLNTKTYTYDYAKTVKEFFAPEDAWENVFPTIMPQWDRTARNANHEGIYVNSTPEHFREHIQNAIDIIKDKQPEHQVLFLKSWNEWAEGNYVEPDIKYGHGYLDAIKECVLG